MTPTTTAHTHKPSIEAATNQRTDRPARPAVNQNRSQPWRPPRWRWPVLLSAVLGLAILGLGYMQATYVSGIELNSHTWEQRAFSYRRDPFTGKQLGGVRHNAPVRKDFWTTVANPRARMLDPAIHAYFSSTTTEPVRWDLIRLDDSLSPPDRASILVDLIEAYDSTGNAFWPGWSMLYPKRAAILWPAAQQLVAQDRYPELPRLFAEALAENSTSEFSRSAGQLVEPGQTKVPSP